MRCYLILTFTAKHEDDEFQHLISGYKCAVQITVDILRKLEEMRSKSEAGEPALSECTRLGILLVKLSSSSDCMFNLFRLQNT